MSMLGMDAYGSMIKMRWPLVFFVTVFVSSGFVTMVMNAVMSPSEPMCVSRDLLSARQCGNALMVADVVVLVSFTMTVIISSDIT